MASRGRRLSTSTQRLPYLGIGLSPWLSSSRRHLGRGLSRVGSGLEPAHLLLLLLIFLLPLVIELLELALPVWALLDLLLW